MIIAALLLIIAVLGYACWQLYRENLTLIEDNTQLRTISFDESAERGARRRLAERVTPIPAEGAAEYAAPDAPQDPERSLT